MNPINLSIKTSSRAWVGTIIAITIVVAIHAPAVGADVFYVGDGGVGAGCTGTDIVDALLAAAFSPGPDEIRVARNRIHVNQWIHLTDWDPALAGSLTIVGGYDSCTDPTPDSGRTRLNGRSGFPVFDIDTVGETSHVTLRNLSIVGVAGGEEGVLVEGDSTVLIENCHVSDHSQGGIVAMNGADVTIDDLTAVSSNQRSSGAGIFCNNATVTSAGVISNNQATWGGGVYAAIGCTMFLNGGSFIDGNTADWGGGVYANTGADVLINGQATIWGARVFSNTANIMGGGIFADGLGTSVMVQNASVIENQARDFGGGILVGNGATVTTDRIAGPCLDSVRCAQISGNTLTGSGFGSVAFITTGGSVSLFQTWVENNSGSGNGGNLFYVEGPDSHLELEGVQLWNNGAGEIFVGENSALIEAAFVSVAENRNEDGNHPFLMVLHTNATAHLNSSIFWDIFQTVLVSGGAIAEADCLIANNTTGLEGASYLSSADPMFRNPAAGDLRLKVGSPAVDYCDDLLFEPLHFDLHHEMRGFDLRESTNGSPGPAGGTFDIGGDEIFYFFEDGFESGTLSGWGSSSP